VPLFGKEGQGEISAVFMSPKQIPLDPPFAKGGKFCSSLLHPNYDTVSKWEMRSRFDYLGYHGEWHRALCARIEWRTKQQKWYIESMSTMISEVYDALKEAGASEEKARKAAVASYENRFARMEGDLGVVKWMIGFNLAMTVAVLWKVFSA
jgi:hypothetical protein